MYSNSDVIKLAVGTLLFSFILTTSVLSADRAVYDKPDVEVPGHTIYGKVIKVQERDAAKHEWEVSVENAATGEVIALHLNRSTERREKEPDPAVGDRVVVKYDDSNKHALTFVKDAPIKP